MIVIHRQNGAKVRRFTHLSTTCSMWGDQWTQNRRTFPAKDQ